MFRGASILLALVVVAAAMSTLCSVGSAAPASADFGQFGNFDGASRGDDQVDLMALRGLLERISRLQTVRKRGPELIIEKLT
ncbi:hypothetical protein BOX15_Mlig002773g3 [Macrostomum lignano]|uniref:Uncharacterized protein n=1 Tax=Macrostomum lignano TaxID=282301 RepID=A0A267FLH4_9PLAT|nr:hypothetical protein BOX15_Mlig002773g2 [Macrostomum lignano]PAA70340.1 hypothetical protein BOX15_Mlig002773g1 [Macrostomum lignano]PAA73889.1 hypothetical protein BOX15_Mlig002773g3 [Macrostomum lignano]